MRQIQGSTNPTPPEAEPQVSRMGRFRISRIGNPLVIKHTGLKLRRLLVEERKKANLRFWRLTQEEFDNQLKPYLNRWSVKNVELLRRIVVDREMQKTVADSSNMTRQTINCLVRRGYGIYSNVKESSSNSTTEKNSAIQS